MPATLATGRFCAADAADAVDLIPSPGAHGLSLTLCDVHFGYRSDRPTLQGVDIHVPAGTSCALVGTSGSGKSSVLRLLFRFFDADQGAVLIDGHDVR